MLVLGMILVVGGYGIGSWGWLLVKGENITLRQWFSPLNPYTGPLDGNGKVPPGHIFPTGKAGAGQQGGGTSQAAAGGGLTPANAPQIGADIGDIISGIGGGVW